jgi:hypothetical protein
MKRVEQAAGGRVRKMRDRMRSVRKKVVAIAMAARQKGAAGEEKRRNLYKGLLSIRGCSALRGRSSIRPNE